MAVGSVGDPGEQPVVPRRGGHAGVGHCAECGEQVDDGRTEGVGLVGTDLLQEPAAASTGDGEPATEPLADGEHLGYGERRRAVAHGDLVGSEAVRPVVEAQHQVLITDPISVCRRPEPTVQHLEFLWLDPVVGAQELDDGCIGGPVVARLGHRRVHLRDEVRTVCGRS